MMCMEIAIEKDWIDVVSSFGIVIVGFITAYIAFRQHKNDTARLKLNVYDKRFEVYQAIREYFSVIFRDGTVSLEDLQQFWIKTTQAEFLFGREVNDKREELYKKGVRLSFVEGRLEDNNLEVGEERNKLADESYDLLNWFDEESKKVSSLFAKYLKID